MTQQEIDRQALRELLTERRDRGVALLDRRASGWWSASGRDGIVDLAGIIDLRRLDMSESGWCVVGQLEDPGDPFAYWNGINRLFGDPPFDVKERHETEVAHGFLGAADRDYPVLTDLWREVIEQRRAAA